MQTLANDTASVLGDWESIKQIANEFAEVYGQEPKLKCLGSLDDLYESMQATFQKDPENIYTWLAQYVTLGLRNSALD